MFVNYEKKNIIEETAFYKIFATKDKLDNEYLFNFIEKLLLDTIGCYRNKELHINEFRKMYDAAYLDFLAYFDTKINDESP